MQWLERYLMLERVFADLEEEGEFGITDALQNGVENIWLHLNANDREYIRGRGTIDALDDLDKVALPPNMIWGSIHQHQNPEMTKTIGAASPQFVTEKSLFFTNLLGSKALQPRENYNKNMWGHLKNMDLSRYTRRDDDVILGQVSVGKLRIEKPKGNFPLYNEENIVLEEAKS